MKTAIVNLLALIFIVAFLSECGESGIVSIRVKNSYSQAIQEVQIIQNNNTGVSFGKIDPGEATGYEIIDNGSINVSGSLVDGTPFSRRFDLYSPDYFTSKWTVTLTNTFDLTLKKD